MIDPYTAISAVSGVFNSGSGGSSSGGSSLSSGLGLDFQGILGGLLGGIKKVIGCLGKQAWDQTVLAEARGYVDARVNTIQSLQDASDTLNDFQAIINSMKVHREQMSNLCTKENMDVYTNYMKSARDGILQRFEVQNMGGQFYICKIKPPHGSDRDTIDVLRVTGAKAGVTNPDLPINGGVGQNEFVPNNSGITYTQDEVDQMIKNASFTSSLNSSDMSSLISLKSQLQNNPNCRGGIKDGKVFLDCSVTNDHTQNVIQIAGLGLTAIGLVYMITSRKKKR